MDNAVTQPVENPQRLTYVLLVSVFVIATCGLVYELIAGTIASYLLGDSVTQFSTVIGVYLFSMGIGSFASRYVTRNLISVFIRVELLIALVGGCSAALMFLLFEQVASFRVLLYGLVVLTGVLVGLEIPLIMRILKERLEFRDLVSQIFTFDYVGALLASLLFPLLLVPYLGLIKTAFMFGLMNAGVALWTIFLFENRTRLSPLLKSAAILLLIFLTFGFVYADSIMRFAETSTYPDNIIYATSSPYQRIVLTNGKSDTRLYLNGNLQFSSRDEYRYHEALVHVGLSAIPSPKNVLVLGGGDGLAVREILKYPSVEHVTLVDLDRKMVSLFAGQDMLKNLNANALNSPKVKLVFEDAFVWLKNNRQRFDFIVVDFPDPGNFSVGKLYTDTFYKALKTALSDRGAMVVQSTSPYYAKKSFWCVVTTLQSVGFKTAPYHAYVPSFGDWGYILAFNKPLPPKKQYPKGLRFLTPEIAPSFFKFTPDMLVDGVKINRLNNQILVHYFEEEWSLYDQAG